MSETEGLKGHASNRPDPEDTHRTMAAIRLRRQEPIQDQRDFNPRIVRLFGLETPVRFQSHRLFHARDSAEAFARDISQASHVKWTKLVLRGNVHEPWLVIYGFGDIPEPITPEPVFVLHETETFTIRVHGTPIDFARSIKIKTLKFDGLEGLNKATELFNKKCLWSTWVRLQRVSVDSEHYYVLEYSLGSKTPRSVLYDRYSGRIRMRPANG